MARDVTSDHRTQDFVRICEDFKDGTRTAVSGCGVAHDFDGLVVADITGDTGATVCTRTQLQTETPHHIYCLIQTAGQLCIDHNRLGSGDCMLLDAANICVMTFTRAGRFLLLQLPRKQILGSGQETIKIGQRLPADHPLAPAIQQQMQHFTAGRESSATVGRANAALITGMIRLAFSDRVDFASDLNVDTKDRQFARALALIQKHLTSTELSLACLSRQGGMSSRQLQRMFEFENTSYSTEVRDRRLTVAAERLRRVTSARRIHISEVAYDSGFRDLSNFNRGFKSRFGMAPSEYIQTVAGVR